MSSVIKIENLSKLYRLGTIGSNSIKDDLKWLLGKVLNKEDFRINSADLNNQNERVINNYVWALKDIDFEVFEGDVIGIIGKNGAGKSTLLKILSRITTPTNGSAKISGRVASLLEVGTGFHPELTGLENIYLNGAILGMTKSEIKRKLDEIIDFSGIEKYINTPVKRYSSGMYVRLAFSIAAHLDSEIMLIDEVLAVGDHSFKEKCLDKMQNISKHGRTVLFVSHNLGSIRSMCNKAVFIESGLIKYTGDTQDTINIYLQSFEKDIGQKTFSIEKNRDAYLKDILLTNLVGRQLKTIPINHPYEIKVKVRLNINIKKFMIGIGFSTLENVALRTIWSEPKDLVKGDYEFTLKEEEIFYTGRYHLHVGLTMVNGKIDFQYIHNAMVIEFEDYVDSNIAVDTKSGLIINQSKILIKRN